MRDGLSAAEVRDALLSAVRPSVEKALETSAVFAVPGVGLSLIVQTDPLVLRVLAEGPATAAEALRLVDSEIPALEDLRQATEAFVSAGLSGLPDPVVEGVFSHAAKPGAGLIVWIRPAEESAACFLAPCGTPLSRAVRLFSIEPEARPEVVTLH